MAKKFLLRWRGHGFIKEAEVIVSNEDAHLMRNKTWRVSYTIDGRPTGVSHNPYKGDVGKLDLCRFILSAGPEHEVEHINGNVLDCRRTNLRLRKLWMGLSIGGTKAQSKKARANDQAQ